MTSQPDGRERITDLTRASLSDPRMTGYGNSLYAAAMADGGRVVELPKSGGRIIVRDVPGQTARDAMAPYPFLTCRSWRDLAADLANLSDPLVSLVAVTGPFADTSEAELGQAFRTFVRPYKPHFVIDLAQPLESIADPHHLGCARHARKTVQTELCSDPTAHVEDWLRLYAVLTERHGISGANLMSAQSLQRQFAVPGLRLFRAHCAGRTIGMIAVMEMHPFACFHLGAYDEEGYRRSASYPLVEAVITHYREAGFQHMSIGGRAGAHGKEDDGLARFKRGWSSGTRMTYLCGHIFDTQKYDALSSQLAPPETDYFPAYRAGEFR